MTRNTHPAQAIPAEADKAREVISYTGLNCGISIMDARTHIRVVLRGETPRGVRGGLKIEGFSPINRDRTVWEAPNTTTAIFGAQAVLDIFYKESFS